MVGEVAGDCMPVESLRVDSNLPMAGAVTSKV